MRRAAMCFQSHKLRDGALTKYTVFPETPVTVACDLHVFANPQDSRFGSARVVSVLPRPQGSPCHQAEPARPGGACWCGGKTDTGGKWPGHAYPPLH